MSNWRRPSEHRQTKEERKSLYFFTMFGFVMACCGFFGLYMVLTATRFFYPRAPVLAATLTLVGVVMFAASLAQLIKSRSKH